MIFSLIDAGDSRVVLVGDAQVELRFESPPSRKASRFRSLLEHERYFGWRCHWQLLPLSVAEALAIKTAGSRRCPTVNETEAFAARIVTALWQYELTAAQNEFFKSMVIR